MPAVLDEAARALGATIRTKRKEQPPAGWSQEALAARMVRLGHPTWRQTTVAKVEAGRRPVSMAEGISLAYALGVPQLDRLYGEQSMVQRLLIENFSTQLRHSVGNAIEAAARVLADHNPQGAAVLRDTMLEVQDMIFDAPDPRDPELLDRVEQLVLSAREEAHRHGVDREA